MKRTSGFGYHHHLMSANSTLSGFPFDAGRHYSFEDPTSRNVPLLPCNGLQESNASELNVSRNHFYDVPRENFHAGPTELGQPKIPTAPAHQKRFLVFDQSGDKTTLMYTQWSPKPHNPYNLNKEGPTYSNFPSRPNTKDEIIEDNSERNAAMEGEEMHEDTEELNALLCSDYDTDISEDDEETSTGHSPSTMTDNGVPDSIEADSFGGPTKRQKLFHAKTSALEDDADSSYGNGCKRSRKEKINETVRVLRNVIPGVDGKEAMVVIDEAIHYLRYLKVKAKSFGLDSL
ncbi:hypothetical protein MIMGU_mgv1a011221mg [Erythranthe guttata]|uniref:BHLH domain-containing protein n=1 Tax=Erythranthe guttata TaxID=4155 RepID=A0A022QF56_ERYGU|nr:PREDICTED: transcription factor bHLH143-like [Erythranthe guttata]EYU26576.1 hypothetical protein MIMGU_mgv1a011221mg [Erythranthe guttata]|eukprot:XP_012850423.1 PREDICTED: transcription factor bHLH143-like [Erythranthe guttata]